MYAENRNYVKFFPTEREGTEKVTYGRLSESLKVKGREVTSRNMNMKHGRRISWVKPRRR